MIVDSAPVLPVADSQALAPRAGTVLMVARAEQTSLGDLIESRKRLAQAGAQVHGVVGALCQAAPLGKGISVA